jgi:phosphoribosyl-ATP pyrophosphohydrolase
MAALLTLKRLAAVAAIVGEECLETWLSAMEERARGIQAERDVRDQGRAA